MDNLRMKLLLLQGRLPHPHELPGYVRLIAHGKEEEAARRCGNIFPSPGLSAGYAPVPVRINERPRSITNRSISVR
jgi:hypothetical protein